MSRHRLLSSAALLALLAGAAACEDTEGWGGEPAPDPFSDPTPAAADDDDDSSPPADDDDDDSTSPDDDDSTSSGDDDDDSTAPEGDCADGADNDQDGFFDCDDADCTADPACAGDDDDDDDDSTPPADDDDDDSTSSTPPGDGDGDGYAPPADCDDSDPAVSPLAWETCDDGVDQDCDALVDCADSDCDDQAACVADDEFEPNDSQADAYDLTFLGGNVFQLVLCEPSPDWFRVCTGEGGSYSATITDYDNAGYLPPATDTDFFSGSTPAGFSLSMNSFGLEVEGTGEPCHWYTLELVVSVPVACP